MNTTKRIADLEARAVALRAELDALEADESIEEWTPELEAMTDRISDEAWRLEDEAAVLKAEAALQAPAFAALVARTLPTMPAGPTNLGDPGVWYGGREYWAYEVVELAESLTDTGDRQAPAA